MIIINPYRFASAGSSYDSDAQAFFTASGLSDVTMMGKYNTLILALKTAGLWANMKALYAFKEGTAAIHKWNIKDPRDLDAAYRLEFMNVPTHSTSGVDWNGSTQYAKTFFYPHTGYTSKDAKTFGYWSGEDTDTAGTKGEMGCEAVESSSYDGLFVKLAGPETYAYTSDVNNTSVANASAIGFFVVTRLNSTQVAFYKNGAALGTNPRTSTSAAAQVTNMMRLGQAGTGQYSDRTCRFAFIYNGSMSATNVSDLYTAANTFLA